MKTKAAMCILAIATTPTAFGNLILSSANFVSGTGLGTEPTLLTIQDSPTEIGCVGGRSEQLPPLSALYSMPTRRQAGPLF